MSNWTCPQCGRTLKNAVLPVRCICTADRSSKEERIAKVKASIAATERLIGWLRRFRLPSESGVGDTAQRLILKSCKYPKAGVALKRLLNQCACERTDAIERLNRDYPY